MSDPKNMEQSFLQRWSRRKRAAERVAPNGIEQQCEVCADADESAASVAGVQGEAAPLRFDPTTLPLIESITAISDVRAFLAPGVPAELTSAALRRAWVTDPTIRDFVGIAENQWDFTKPDGVPGFGSLELTPELRSMVAGLFGDASGQIAPQPRADTKHSEILEKIARPEPTAGVLVASREDVSAEPSNAHSDLVTSQGAPPDPAQVMPQDGNYVATQKNIGEAGQSPGSAYRHGGALPK